MCRRISTGKSANERIIAYICANNAFYGAVDFVNTGGKEDKDARVNEEGPDKSKALTWRLSEGSALIPE
jgi:hypothetical protein